MRFCPRFIGPLLFLAIVSALCLPARSQEKPPAKPNFTLNSTEPYHAVHIPVVIRNGEVLVLAKLAGKLIWCQVDTGSSMTAWASWLKLPCRPTGLLVGNADASAIASLSDIVFLPEVELGGYQIRELVSSRTFTGEREDSPSSSYVHRIPLLSGTAFAPIVFTLDYAHSELILRDHTYDITRPPRKKNDILLDFALKPVPIPDLYFAASKDNLDTWQGEQLKHGGIPYIKSLIAGNVASSILDTGWTGKAISISEGYFQKTMAKKKWKSEQTDFSSTSGSAKSTQIANVPFAFPSGAVSLTPANILALPMADSVIGSEILQHYRVTIDYQRRKILLEPNDLSAPETAPFMPPPPPRRADPGFFWKYYIGIGWVQKEIPPAKGGNPDGSPGTSGALATPPNATLVGTTVKDGVNYLVWSDNTVTPLPPVRLPTKP